MIMKTSSINTVNISLFLQDECSFVSLRDVERVLDVMSWFYAKSIGNDMLFEQLADDNNDEIDAVDQPKVTPF